MQMNMFLGRSDFPKDNNMTRVQFGTNHEDE